MNPFIKALFIVLVTVSASAFAETRPNDASQQEAQTSLIAEMEKTVRDRLVRALASEDSKEIRRIHDELQVFVETPGVQELRSSSGVPGQIYHIIRILDRLAAFRDSLAAENPNEAADHLSKLMSFRAHAVHFIGEKDWQQAIDKLEQSGGIRSLKDYGEHLTRNMSELLDDRNQDRLEEILEAISKEKATISRLQTSKFPGLSSRWQRLESFATAMWQGVQQVRAGDRPKFNIEQWTGFDTGYAPLMKKADMVRLLKAYRIKVVADDKKITEARLYYDADELRKEADELFAELMDDANQDRLDEIGDRISDFRQFCSSFSSSSDMYPVSRRFQQLENFARTFSMSVRQAQDGGTPRINLDEWLRSSSEYAFPLKRGELSALLQNYRVKVRQQNGKVTEEPLYQEAREVMKRMATLDDLARELPLLTRLARSSAGYDSSTPYQILLPQFTALAEIHANLQKNASFVLLPQSLNYGWDRPAAYAGQPDDPQARAVMERLRDEAERCVIRRFFPDEAVKNDALRDEFAGGLLKKGIEEKNHETIIQLNRITGYFRPSSPLIAPQEALAIQNYVDGLRQVMLGQPRLAVLHFQRAAAGRSTIIADTELKERLQKLKAEHPQEYEKGTDDAISSKQADPQTTVYSPAHALAVPAAR
jgi:hypothetical protein